MCGIFVAIHKKTKLNQSDESVYHRATAALSFRGPDLKIESTFYNQLYLGQTVLSLTGDVTKSNGEHLVSKSNRYKIAFNGEIYNYLDLYKKHQSSLLTNNHNQLTDSEVLVNLFDQFELTQIPQLIDGMYAFALLDQKEKKLVISRDPQGEKSLYIFENDDVIYISSEIRAILSVIPNLKLNKEVFCDYFTTRHFMFLERTPFLNIRQLKPGMTLSFDLENKSWKQVHELSMKSWIKPDLYEKNRTRHLDDLTDELESLIEEACREMIPLDRHFASVVSGGVDSSLLSHFALKHGTPKLLLAVNHVGKDEISHDLLGFEKVFKRKVSVVDVDRVIYAQSLRQCQNSLSGPVFSHSFVGQSLQSQYARSQGCLAMFGGEGADELFGGYSAYLDSARRSLNTQYSNSPYSGYYPLTSFKNNHHEIIQDELKNIWSEAKSAYSFLKNDDEKCAQAMMYADLAYQLPAVGLRGADLMSMMWSLETRSVFIRRKIVQFGLNLPLEFKCDAKNADPLLSSKKILKNLFLRIFPRELLVKKQGFSGFPNESGAFIGNKENFLALDFLGLEKSQLATLSNEAQWKLINIEYFLREQLK